MKIKTLLRKEMEQYPETGVITNHQQQHKKMFSTLIHVPWHRNCKALYNW